MMMPQAGGGRSGGGGGERSSGLGALPFAPFMTLYPSGGSTNDPLPPSMGLGVGSSQGYVDIDQNERRVRRRLSSEERLQRK